MRSKGIDWSTQPLGQVPDSEIARSLGVKRPTVSNARAARGIAAYVSPDRVAWDDVHDLGESPNWVIAERLGCSPSAVNEARIRAGKAPYDGRSYCSACRSPGHVKTTCPQRLGIDWISLLGTMPDEDLAKKCNRAPEAIRLARVSRGIPSFRETSGVWMTKTRGSSLDGVSLAGQTIFEIAAATGVHPSTAARQRRRRGEQGPPADRRYLRLAQRYAESRGEKPPTTIGEARRRAKQRAKQNDAAKERRRSARKRAAAGVVLCIYFLRCGDWIKIGSTTNLAQRLKTYDTNCPPYDLLGITAESPGMTEGDIHARFASLRRTVGRAAGGEWFKADIELLAFIKQVTAKPSTEPCQESTTQAAEPALRLASTTR